VDALTLLYYIAVFCVMLRVESKLKRLLREAMGRDGNITELS